MKPKFIILSIIVLLIASTGIAVADETATATPTSSSDTRRSDATPASENESVLLVLDESTRLVSKSYDRETGTLSLVFYSDRYQSVSLVAPRDTSSEQGTAAFVSQYLQPEQKTTVTIQAQPGSKVWITTDQSATNGELHWVEPTGGGSFIGGPWTGVDARDAGIGASLGTALAALLVITRERYGLHRGMEREA